MYIEGINEEISAARGEQPDESSSINLMDKGFKVRQGSATVAEDYDEDEEGPDGV
jgi:hypothetical protein